MTKRNNQDIENHNTNNIKRSKVFNNDDDISMSTIFDKIQNDLSIHDNKKEKIIDSLDDIKQLTRDIMFICTKLHNYINNDEELGKILNETIPDKLKLLKNIWQDIINVINNDSIEEWSRLWQYQLSSLSFAVGFFYYLKYNKLASPDIVSELLYINEYKDKSLTLDIETYLNGIVLLPKEMSRLSMNYVRYEKYDKVKELSDFVNELYAGFQLLNLRNDGLRRKFDGIKYEINKLDQILYDISVRKL